MTRFFLVMLLVFGIALPANAIVEYYVAPNGTGGGVSASDPASLATARTLAQSAINSSDVTIYLRGNSGAYRLSSTLTLTANDSGSNGHTLTWKAYPGDPTPAVIGSIQITGWTLYDAANNIYAASVPAGTVSRQLYVNGAKATRSHYAGGSTVNYSGGGGLGTTFTTRLGDVYSSDAGLTYRTSSVMPTFSRPTDLEFVVQAYQWVRQRAGVASVSTSAGVTTFNLNSAVAAWNNHEPNRFPQYPIDIENAYEFLSVNTPSNWYLNTATNKIYYVAAAGENVAGEVFELPVIETLIANSESSPATNVHFDGISFMYTGWTAPTTTASFLHVGSDTYYTVAGGTVTGTAHPPAGIIIRSGSGFSFTHCTFAHMGGNGLNMNCPSSTMDRNTFTDISSYAARFDSDTLFTNNTVYNVAWEYAGVTAVAAWGRYSKANHNEIYNVPYSAINPVAGSADAECAYNKIHEAMQLLHDGGAIYTYGSDDRGGASLQVHDNYIYNTQAANSATYVADSAIFTDNNTNHEHYYNNVIIQSANGNPKVWFNNNSSNSSATDIVVDSNNYATSGMTYHPNGTQYITVPNPIYLSGTSPSGWPSAAQAIAAASGPTDVIVISNTAAANATMRASFR